MWDLIVVGLGPAGSTAARIAAEMGLKVLGLDREVFPRYKPCAAGLTGRALKEIPVDCDEYIELKITTALISLYDLAPIPVENEEGLMFTTRRETMDTLLVKAAGDSGAVIREGFCVKSLEERDVGITVKSIDGQEEQARFVVGADGANGKCNRYLNKGIGEFLPSWEVEFSYDRKRNEPMASCVRFDLGIVKRGYGWAFPKNDTVAVGVAGKLSSRAEVDQAFKAMMSRLPGSASWNPLIQRGHPIPVFNSKRIFGGSRVLLTGDAGGLIDPFLGEGIYHALVSGRIAANWVSSNLHNDTPDYEGYKREISKTIGSELKLAARLAAVIYRFPGLMFRITSRSPGVLKNFAESLCSDGGYKEFSAGVGYPYKLIFLNM